MPGTRESWRCVPLCGFRTAGFVASGKHDNHRHHSIAAATTFTARLCRPRGQRRLIAAITTAITSNVNSAIMYFVSLLLLQ